MAQHPKFYTLHGEDGLKFKRLFIDTGIIYKTDAKGLGFPISQINNVELVELFITYVDARHAYTNNLLSFEDYQEIKWQYQKHLPLFHKH